MATLTTMMTAPLTLDDLRREVEAVQARYGMSVDEFVANDLDDLPSDELRDIWLMVKGALTTAL